MMIAYLQLQSKHYQHQAMCYDMDKYLKSIKLSPKLSQTGNTDACLLIESDTLMLCIVC